MITRPQVACGTKRFRRPSPSPATNCSHAAVRSNSPEREPVVIDSSVVFTARQSTRLERRTRRLAKWRARADHTNRRGPREPSLAISEEAPMNGAAVSLFARIGLSIVVCYYASAKKNHSPIVWFLLALFFSPLLAGLVALIMGAGGAPTPMPFAGTPFEPTLRVPLEGMQSWPRPDPAGASTPLAGGL